MATTILIRRRYFYPCLKQAPSSTKCQAHLQRHTSRHCCTLSNELSRARASFFFMAWQQGPGSLDLRGGWGLNGKSLRLFLLSDPRCWRSTTTSTRLAPERRSVAAASHLPDGRAHRRLPRVLPTATDRRCRVVSVAACYGRLFARTMAACFFLFFAVMSVAAG
jgi:hypothetical protein